jgi:hypothetical protein
MNKLSALLRLGFALALFVVAWLALSQTSTQAQGPLPANQPARGLIYDGLAVPRASAARGLYRIKLSPAIHKTLYTHGPDFSPLGWDVRKTRPRITTSKLTAAAAPTVVCDGDGVSGNRVQVMYVHAAGTPDNYSTDLASIQQWAADADADFANSAAQTGGYRHIRYVTDANCSPVVLDVQVSSTGTSNIGNTASELWAMGYNLTNRVYMLFVDAHVYCGIGAIANDDSPGPGNVSNLGPSYGRTDAGCWSGDIPAHELMHNLGGVQLSAPHSDGNWHCTDGMDDMCDHSGLALPTPYPCPDSANGSLFDCNHDDYFSTNPAPGSYLATHWNTANSVFLIGAVAPSPTATPTPLPTATPQPTATATSATGAGVNSLQTGKMAKGKFSPTDQFKLGSAVYVLSHVVDQSGGNLTGASVSMSLLTPAGKTWCAFSATSDSNGNALGSCKVGKNAPVGSWDAHAGAVSTGTSAAAMTSAADQSFTVQ